MATDPEAARAVFQSGIKMEMYGYNAELKSAFTNAEIGRIVDGANGPYTTAFAMSGMSHKPDEPIYYGPFFFFFFLSFILITMLLSQRSSLGRQTQTRG